MMNKLEIETKLSALKAEYDAVRGTPTEVYTRIVGYYRSVKNWNAGKREEYGFRKHFAVPATSAAQASESASPAAKSSRAVTVNAAAIQADPRAYMFFTRKTCPNCPPVKDFMGDLQMDGTHHDVDTEEGLSAARKFGVMASPTVIFFDNNSNELFRAHSVTDLKSCLPNVRA
jgi:ribonucleoside-triphosphate reductase